MDKGAIIMLAWPETRAIQVGSWYEPLMSWLGFNQGGYYKAGHSAVVLVTPKSGILHYFDFGRYHTPPKYGRVRNRRTDPDLNLKETAILDEDGKIINLQKLLLALSKYKSFHGKGNMFASVNYEIDFTIAFEFAKNQQNLGVIPYGPFAYKGTNCSRFTSRVFRVGSNNWFKKLQTILPLSLTQTPLGNVLIVSDKNNFFKVENSFIHSYQANIFEFLKRWTLPPLMAIPLVFKKNDGLSPVYIEN